MEWSPERVTGTIDTSSAFGSPSGKDNRVLRIRLPEGKDLQAVKVNGKRIEFQEQEDRAYEFTWEKDRKYELEF